MRRDANPRTFRPAVEDLERLAAPVGVVVTDPTLLPVGTPTSPPNVLVLTSPAAPVPTGPSY